MNILHTDKEQRIIKLFDRGDSTAMDVLYAEYADYLTGICYRYIGNDDDMKDVLQEAFIKIFTQIRSFRYRGKGSLKAWMTRIVVNESLMFLRKQSRTEETLSADEPPDIADDPPDTSGLDVSMIMDMIAKLPTGYRVVFNLFAIDGLSHKQIAGQLHITPSTSASQFHKARNMLAKMIRKYKQEQEYERTMD